MLRRLTTALQASPWRWRCRSQRRRQRVSEPSGDHHRGLHAGGPSDVLARIIGRRLQDILHQPFIIENRPGSGGNIAAEQTAHAAPDGYTLLMGNNSILATNAALYKKLAYDPEKDFVPISLIGTQANILVVNPSVPANTMAELIALAKASPGN
jgi:tripartite-type tricarboxylate transporter receptor subunit TctC